MAKADRGIFVVNEARLPRAVRKRVEGLRRDGSAGRNYWKAELPSAPGTVSEVIYQGRRGDISRPVAIYATSFEMREVKPVRPEGMSDYEWNKINELRIRRGDPIALEPDPSRENQAYMLLGTGAGTRVSLLVFANGNSNVELIVGGRQLDSPSELTDADRELLQREAGLGVPGKRRRPATV